MFRKNRALLLPLLLIGALTAACAPPGPHVRVAAATAADLKAVEGEDTVWYEFRKGDVVPFEFLLIGLGLATTETPIELRATQDFWIVMSKDGPWQISLDGESVSTEQAELLTAIVPGEDGRAKVMWLNYIGTGSATEELERLSNSGAVEQTASPE